MTTGRSSADARPPGPHDGPARRPVLALVAALLVLCVVAACGQGTPPGPGGSPSEVTIGKAVDTIGFTTVDVAAAKGYFAKQGVSVKQELLGGSSTAFAALQSGGVHFVTASSAALLAARAKGVPLQAVASLDYGVSLQMIVSNRWTAAHGMTPGQPLNTVMKGLSGASLGVISTTDQGYNEYLSKQAGVASTQFTVIQFKTQAAALAAIEHGQIDAFLLSPPNSYLAEAQGYAKVVATLHSVPELSGMTYDVLVVDSDYARSNPDTVRSVATAMAMADQTMAKDPNSVLDVERPHYPGMSDDVLLRSLKYVTFAPDGTMSEQGWQAAKGVSMQTGAQGVDSVDVSPGSGTWTNEYIKTGDLQQPGGPG